MSKVAIKRIGETPSKPVVEEKPKETLITDSDPQWKRISLKKAQSTYTKCIVIDKNDHWHTGALVDLKGIDTTAFTWGYYGTQYPVLVEGMNDKLEPYYLQDAVGESSTRLFKGANPDGFRSVFRHRNTLLQKVAVGLMVALVLGLCFMIYFLSTI